MLKKFNTIEEMELGILSFIKNVNDTNSDCYILNERGPGAGAVEIAIVGEQNKVYTLLRLYQYDIDYALQHDYVKTLDKDGFVCMLCDGFSVSFSPLDIFPDVK